MLVSARDWVYIILSHISECKRHHSCNMTDSDFSFILFCTCKSIEIRVGMMGGQEGLLLYRTNKRLHLMGRMGWELNK